MSDLPTLSAPPSTPDSLPTLPVVTEAGILPCRLHVPESGRGAGLVLVHEIFGVSAYMQQRAQDLCALGWTVALPNLYWRHGGAAVDEDDPEALAHGMALMNATDWDLAVSDVQATVGALRSLGATRGETGLVGFCYGGGLAYAAASTALGSDVPDVLVSYYGSALPGLVDAVPGLQVPQLHHFGDADAFIPPDQVQHVREVVSQATDAEFHLWPGAGHAFDNPMPEFHHAEASQAAWQVTVDWLGSHFPA